MLVVFGVMLTAQGPFISMKTGPAEWAIAMVVGLLLYGVLAVSTVLASWPGTTPAVAHEQQAAEANTANAPSSMQLGKGLLGMAVGPAHNNSKERTSYLLPFEIVSVHLLVVLIGAAYLAGQRRRRDDFNPSVL